jgi:hypothetical protein
MEQRVAARFAATDKKLLEKINKTREGTQPPKSPLSEMGFNTAMKAVEELKRVLKNVSNDDYKVIAMLHGHDIAK